MVRERIPKNFPENFANDFSELNRIIDTNSNVDLPNSDATPVLLSKATEIIYNTSMFN